MSSRLALPCQGHLDALFHMFGYLNGHHNSDMVFDSSEPDVNLEDFKHEDWCLSIYGDVKEEVPPVVPFEESGPWDTYARA